LAKILGSRRYKNLLKKWNDFLLDPSLLENTPVSSEIAILKTASRRIWKLYRSILKSGGRIGENTPAEELHRLRIMCKKLRYLIEFFQTLYSKKKIRNIIKVLRRLQDNLGDFNDYHIQQENLAMFARQMSSDGSVNPDTLLVMGRLMQQMHHGQQLERKLFSERFKEFSSTANRRKFKNLFKHSVTRE
jgi:CHAD domain-containing protein